MIFVEGERGKNDYKLPYYVSPHIQYGEDITISEGFCDTNKEIERIANLS